MMHSDSPHRRYNSLSGEWILVSPHRTKRPWQGKVEAEGRVTLPAYDPGCYLCPGNQRAGGTTNPDYKSTYVFDNDFAALLPDTPEENISEKNLLVAESEQGLCRVLCFSPRHDLTLALMGPESIKKVIDTWADQYTELGSLDFINYVQIFENRGDIMGCSNPHPHGQIWANKTLPHLVSKENFYQEDYKRRNNECLLCDYLSLEIEKKERVVFENDEVVVVVPFWAIWPFEVLLMPKEHVGDLTQLSEKQRNGLADALKRLGVRYDNLFKTSFPYSMGIHQRPTDGRPHHEWHLHFHYYPPLLRSATVKKFMVGYEMMAQAQRDITAESAAERLRQCPEKHFTED